MPLMMVAAICAKCSEIRAKSKFTFQRGDPIKAPLQGDDFVPVGTQPQPRDGEAAKCVVCDTVLTLRPVPVETANGLAVRSDTEPAPVDRPGPGVLTLFAAQQGEEVKEMRNIGVDKILVITTRRILTVDLAKLVEEL